MLHVPSVLLDKVKCSTCEGYLSTSPVMTKNEKPICGKCYKILPKNEQKVCSRQQIYEILAEYVNFPCRYKINGCTYKYRWNNENGHESECPHRFPVNYVLHKDNSTTCSAKCESVDLTADLKFELQQKLSHSKLCYQIDIRGSRGKHLSVSRENTNESIKLDGSILLKEKPEIVHSSIKAKPLHEHQYETIIYDTSKKCLTCKQFYENVFVCNHGHTSCYNCIGPSCVNCNNSLKIKCRNFNNGCVASIVSPTAKSSHEILCEFTPVNCPVKKCGITDIMANIRIHLEQAHQDDPFVVQSHETSKTFGNKDDSVVFVCFDRVFKCTYYAYESYVEFFLLFLGPAAMSSKFLYEVSINDKKRRGLCCNINDSMLAKGVAFDKFDIGVHDFESDFEIVFGITLMQR